MQVKKNRDKEKKTERQGRENVGVFQALALTTTIGMELAITVSLGYYGGKYLDAKFGTGPWFLLAGVLIGLAVGVVGIHKTLQVYFERE